MKPGDVKEEFDQLVEYNAIIHQCIICSKGGKDIAACKHDNANLYKKIIFKFNNVFFVKETMRPFALVIAYFLFHTMSGIIPMRPNMVNVCKALGMKFDPKAIVVSRLFFCCYLNVILMRSHLFFLMRYVLLTLSMFIFVLIVVVI